MPQLSLYLDEATMEVLRDSATRENKTLSKFVANTLRERHHDKGWPQGFFDLYGAAKADGSFCVPADTPFTHNDIPSFDKA